MRCDRGAECKTPGRAVDDRAHTFSGYGFHLRFHPECCSGGEDGMMCARSHPRGWQPSADNAEAREHDDPDNTGQCIRCGVILDSSDEDYDAWMVDGGCVPRRAR